jgi:DNA-binding NarL/FixJ family response regulator
MTSSDASPADQRPVRVLIVDDHPVVRAGLAGLLSDEPSMDVVGQAADGEQAVRLAAELAVDVVLMDLRMPGLDGVAATRQITKADATVRVLVLTTYESDEYLLAAIEAGASGYLLKASPPEEIVAGVLATAEGTAALSPSVATRLVARARSGGKSEPAPDSQPGFLSPREHEVLALVAQGCSNRQIARRLMIGEATVKTHLLNLFAKLEVSDRTRAVTRAQELGLR